MENFVLIIMGLFTGLIDSVVGGGGLISLPTLSLLIAPGPDAIGTNKIVGTLGAATALFVYARKGHLRIKEGIYFCLICALGSFFGSSLAPFVSTQFFKYLLIFMCPVILWIVFNKNRFVRDIHSDHKINPYVFLLFGLFSGFYDGFFGPGGGTFMFLSLYLGTGFPLLSAIAISKLANTISAATALTTYQLNGFVHWREGLMMGVGMLVGSYWGASMAAKWSHKIIRPMLVVVVSLLLIKLVFFE